MAASRPGVLTKFCPEQDSGYTCRHADDRLPIPSREKENSENYFIFGLCNSRSENRPTKPLSLPALPAVLFKSNLIFLRKPFGGVNIFVLRMR